MPSPPPVSRRTALAGTAALTAALASACTTDGTARPRVRTAPRRAPEGPDVALAASVLGDERAMLERVAATVRRHPGLAAALAGARSAHRAHVTLLGEAVPDGTTPTPSPSAAVQPSPVSTRPGPALSALAGAETRLAAQGRRSALASESGAFARVLASMAAAAAQQAVLLGAEARARR